jgi:hypothetical protein
MRLPTLEGEQCMTHSSWVSIRFEVLILSFHSTDGASGSQRNGFTNKQNKLRGL